MKYKEARECIGMEQKEFIELVKQREFESYPTVNNATEKQLPCGCIKIYNSDRPNSERRHTCPNPQLSTRDFNVRYRTDYVHERDEHGNQVIKAVKTVHQVNWQANGKYITKHYKKERFTNKKSMLAECAKYLDPVEIICLGDSDEL